LHGQHRVGQVNLTMKRPTTETSRESPRVLCTRYRPQKTYRCLIGSLSICDSADLDPVRSTRGTRWGDLIGCPRVRVTPPTANSPDPGDGDVACKRLLPSHENLRLLPFFPLPIPAMPGRCTSTFRVSACSIEVRLRSRS
jgi:hypothetical protein